jgi:hypothetical protein
LVLGINDKQKSKMPNFTGMIAYYETMLTSQKDKIFIKKMQFKVSQPNESIFTFDDKDVVAFKGGTFSYLRIRIGFGEETESKFSSFYRLIDIVPYIKSVEILKVVFGNIVKAYQQFTNACTQAELEDKAHRSVSKEIILIHYPSFEVILPFPLDDRSNTGS